MKNPHEAKLYDVLASCYEVELEPADADAFGYEMWIATVYLVTKTSRQTLFVTVHHDETEARDEAYQFLKDRPR